MSKFLDLEKLEYNDKIVEIDDDIAEAILELNRKGYKTYACCSGHSNIEFYPFEAPLDKKEKILESHDLIYDETDKLYCVMTSSNTQIYIKFDGHYDFESLPEGFDYYTVDDQYKKYQQELKENPDAVNNYVFGDVISKIVNLWDYENEHYITPRSIIEEEIKKADEDLLKWVKELKPINKSR